jgi:hypothetical protein
MTARYLQTCKRKGGGKEQASTKQKGSPRHFGTYSAASALKRSTCRGRCCVVKQLVSQKSQVTHVKRLQPLIPADCQRAAWEPENAQQWPRNTTIYGQIARRPQTTAPPAHGRATTRCAPRRAVLQESGPRLRNRELKPTRPIKSYRLHRKAKWRE